MPFRVTRQHDFPSQLELEVMLRVTITGQHGIQVPKDSDSEVRRHCSWHIEVQVVCTKQHLPVPVDSSSCWSQLELARIISYVERVILLNTNVTNDIVCH